MIKEKFSESRKIERLILRKSLQRKHRKTKRLKIEEKVKQKEERWGGVPG